MVDAGGNVSAEARWDAFGEVRSGDVSSAVAGGGFGLHGMWLDEGTRLYYVRARSYDARTGRFLSRDPVAGVTARPETMSPYLFVASNPTIFVDPSGRFLTGLMARIVILARLAATALAAYLPFLNRVAALRQTRRVIRDAGQILAQAPERVARADLFGAAGRFGKVWQRDVLYISARGRGAMRGVVKAFEAEARNAGAEVLRIRGLLVHNAKLVSKEFVELAGRFDFKVVIRGSVERGTGYIELVKKIE